MDSNFFVSNQTFLLFFAIFNGNIGKNKVTGLAKVLFLCKAESELEKNVYLCTCSPNNAEARGRTLRDESLYIGEALSVTLCAWRIGIWQFQTNSCQESKQQWRSWVCNIRHANCWWPLMAHGKKFIVYIHIGVGFGVVSALYIARHYFLFVTYLIINRYTKTQT